MSDEPKNPVPDQQVGSHPQPGQTGPGALPPEHPHRSSGNPRQPAPQPEPYPAPQPAKPNPNPAPDQRQNQNPNYRDPSKPGGPTAPSRPSQPSTPSKGPGQKGR